MFNLYLPHLSTFQSVQKSWGDVVDCKRRKELKLNVSSIHNNNIIIYGFCFLLYPLFCRSISFNQSLVHDDAYGRNITEIDLANIALA